MRALTGTAAWLRPVANRVHHDPLPTVHRLTVRSVRMVHRRIIRGNAVACPYVGGMMVARAVTFPTKTTIGSTIVVVVMLLLLLMMVRTKASVFLWLAVLKYRDVSGRRCVWRCDSRLLVQHTTIPGLSIILSSSSSSSGVHRLCCRLFRSVGPARRRQCGRDGRWNW